MTDSSVSGLEATSDAPGEAHYRSLFASIDEGFALCEIIRDAAGEAVDYRILDANPATEAILGIPPGDAIGRTVRELVPEVEDDWIATCARAGLGGESIRLEQYMPWFDQWIEIYLTPNGEPGDGHFAAVYNDRTASRRAEEALRRDEQRQEFLLKLSDALRPLADAVAIEAATTRLLGEHLGVGRALYGEVESDEETFLVRRDYVDGLPSVVGVHRLSAFGFIADEYRAGRSIAFSDAASDSRFSASDRAAYAAIGIRAGVGVPLVKGGRLVAVGGVHHREPREWADHELALIAEVAERTWASLERSRAERALREREARQTFLLRFNDASRAEPDAEAIATVAVRLLAEELGVDRGYVVSLDLAAGQADVTHRLPGLGVRAVPETLRLADLPEALRQISTHTIAFDDVANDPRLSELDRRSLAAMDFGAVASATARSGGGNPVWGLVAVSQQPRHWTAGEVALIEELTERAWTAIERARADAALYASEQKYRNLFESIDEGVTTFDVILDEQGRCVDYRLVETNPAMTRLTGVTDAVIGKRATEIVSSVDQCWLDVLERVVRTGTPERVEYPFPALERWFEAYVSRVGGDGSRRLVGVYEDVTERKRTEHRQRFLLELSDTLRPLADPLAVQVEASRVLGEHLRASRVLYIEVESDGDVCVVHRDYVDAVPSVAGRYALSSYETQTREQWLAGKTVVYADVEANESLSADQRASIEAVNVRAWVGVPLLKGGRLAAVLAVHQSVPRPWSADEIELVKETAERTWAAVERARAEAALRDSQETLRRALAIETVGVVFFDLDGTITEANDAFLRMAGDTGENVERSRLRLDELTPPEWQGANARALEEARTVGHSMPYEKEYFRQDGSRWPALSAATMLTETRGVEFVLDLSGLRAAEAAAREERERRDRLEREFVANAAHELRTPLTAIIGAVDALAGGAMDDPAARERFFGHLLRESARLARLSDSLLLLAQAESLKPPTRTRVAVRRLLEDVAAELELPEGLAVQVTAPRTLQMLSHRGLVERIVANLLENAVKHAPAGRIELRGRATPSAVLIEVRDTGSGMSGETKERAFDRFYRGEIRSADGFGLGLSIAAQAAAALHGRLELRPRRGGGTVARLVLPTVDDDAGERASGTAE